MTQPIVNQEDPVIEDPTPEPVVPEPAPAPKPGEKTDSAQLLKSLQEERERRRIAEEALAAMSTVPEKTGVAFSDEGKLLEQQISEVKGQLAVREEREKLQAAQAKYPALADKQAEFDAYRSAPENAGMSIETAAKAFVIENDLLEKPAPRKGLERPTGGERTPQKQGRTPEEIAELRTNNYKQYVRELKAGTIQLDS